MTIFGKIIEKISNCKSSICAGIDPHTLDLPQFMNQILLDSPEHFLYSFSKSIIDASASELSTVKFQSGFFEVFGAAGWTALQKSMKYAKSKGLIVVLDAKRGDISTTMAAYGKMSFDTMEADLLTVTSYMGTETIKPLVPWLKNGKGVYMVWISSNPGGEVVQDLAADALLKETIKVLEQNSVKESLGLVVGATKVDAMAEEQFRDSMKHPLLMPGIGPQGGAVGNRIRKILEANNGTLIPMSRGIAGLGDIREISQIAGLTNWANSTDYVSNKIISLKRDLAI